MEHSTGPRLRLLRSGGERNDGGREGPWSIPLHHSRTSESRTRPHDMHSDPAGGKSKRPHQHVRPTPALDLRHVNSTVIVPPGETAATLFDQGTQLHYELRPRSLPVFHLHDHADPLQFYERVRPLGERYGAVKVRLDGKKKPKGAPHVDHVWFQARTQSLRSSRQRRRHVLCFHRRLYECHLRLGHLSQRVPSIDKRTLDLYRLWQCVQLRGGYDAVCQGKLWAQIGRELGYSGRIMSSLSTSLRSAYVKVLLDLELEPGAGEGELGPDEEPDGGVYHVACSADECRAIRGVRRWKGLPTSRGRAAEGGAAPAAVLPGYDPERWLTGMEVYDASRYETSSSPVYSLKQYYERSLCHLERMKRPGCPRGDKWEQACFEKWYFDALAHPGAAAVDIDTGVGLCSTTHNFAAGDRCDYDAWQPGNVPLHERSLLRYLDLDWSRFTRPAVDVGMLFSTRAWSTEPMGMPSVTYHHLGSAKLWYVVAPAHRDKFERLAQTMAEGFGDAAVVRQDAGDAGDAAFQNSDFYRSFLETHRAEGERGGGGGGGHVTQDPLVPTGRGAGQPPVPGDLQIAPHVLEAHGIELLKVTQERGTYLFTFPRAYSCSVDSSFCVSERALFAPASWLDHLGAPQQGAPQSTPQLLPFQFLVNVATKSCDAARAKSLTLLKPLIEKELLNRQRLNEMSLHYAVVDNKFDFVSDVSLLPTGASKIVMSEHGQCVTLSLDEFLRYAVTGDALGTLGTLGTLGARRLADLHVQLHVYYRDSVLQAILGGPERARRPAPQKSLTAEDVATLVNVTYAGRRIPMERLKQLQRGGDVLLHAIRLQNECCLFLGGLDGREPPPAHVMAMGGGFNLVELPRDAGGFDVEALHKLQLALRSCSVHFPEMDEVFRLCAKVSRFQSSTRKALRAAGKDLQELKRCYSMARSCQIKSKYTRVLASWICKLEWLKVYAETFAQPSSRSALPGGPHNYSLHSMEWFLTYGAKYCGPDDLDKLNEVKCSIVRTRAVTDRITRLVRCKRAKPKILIKDITSLLELIDQERFPIHCELVQLLRSIVDSISRARNSSAPPWNLVCSANEPYARALREHIGGGDALEALKLFPQFDGGSADKRICMKDAAEGKILAKPRRACKLWLADVSRLCRRGGGLHKFSHCVDRCLDVGADTCADSDTNQALYCFCRNGDVSGTMVECEVCKEWYHTRCIRRGSWELPEESVFVCSLCSGTASDGEPPPVVEYSTVAELVIESLDLKLLPDRDTVSHLFNICGKMLLFRQKMESELFKNGTVRADAPLHKIKHFLRKAQGCKCAFGRLTTLLQDHCRGENMVCLENLTKNGSVVLVTGRSPHQETLCSLGVEKEEQPGSLR